MVIAGGVSRIERELFFFKIEEIAIYVYVVKNNTVEREKCI